MVLTIVTAVVASSHASTIDDRANLFSGVDVIALLNDIGETANSAARAI
jgi:hypothetical protein